jgi:hypothetical protein
MALASRMNDDSPLLRRAVISLHDFRTTLGVVAVLIANLLCAQAAIGQTRPASYSEFDTSVAPGDAAALKAAIEGDQVRNIYIQRGYYLLKNPVVINRTDSLFLHGVDRMFTILAASDPSQPLFLVQNAPLLNFAGLHFWPSSSNNTVLNSVALQMQNTQPTVFEMLDCALENSMLAIQGPGSYRIQSSVLLPNGRVQTPLLINHPGADVFVFGGDATNGPETRHVSDFAFVWQKQGRLRLYATTFEGGLGPSDIRVESGAAQGAHIIANVRSEGVDGALNRTGAVSRILYVPPTSAQVDVLLKSNGGAWDTGPTTSTDQRMNCKLISYNAAGTVWLLGNRAEGYCGRELAEGNAPQATIVSVGNIVSSPQPFSIIANRIISASDLFSNYQWTGGSRTNPLVRWIPHGSLPPKLRSQPNVPEVPDDTVPSALMRPPVTAALPGMINVTAPPYGAKGDGVNDDTSAIQNALNANCTKKTPKAIYFPAGNYRITSTLLFNHHSGATCQGAFPYGGWIAGAGSGQTTIAMDPSLKKGVFATDGLSWATIQGITFKTWAYQGGDPQAVNFNLEFYPGYIASQDNNFYDVGFDGGFIAFGTGVTAPTGGNCSATTIFRGQMKNAHIGFASGHFNALANGVYDSVLTNNDYALGSWTNDVTNMPPGGTFYAYNSVTQGTRVQDSLFAGSANGSTWYYNNWVTDAPLFFVTAPTAAGWPIMYEKSRVTPQAGKTYLFDIASSVGPFFLRSTVTRSGIRIGQTSMGQSYAVRMQSQIGDWTSVVAPSPNGQADEIDWTQAQISAPGTPQLLVK